jgi:predicted RNA-binding protein associated with RNAse of E/G family
MLFCDVLNQGRDAVACRIDLGFEPFANLGDIRLGFERHLFDLPELAQALDLGLVSKSETRDILHRVDWVVNQVSKGGFPFPEILEGQEACKQLGW